MIDGNFQVAEWTPAPLIQFFPAENPSNLVQVYFTRDGGHLYLAFLMNDATENASDSLRIYFDTTNNGGDPDTADRFFQIARDGTMFVQAGEGSNIDGLNWNSGYSSGNWSAVLTTTSNQWVVEMQIDAAAEISSLSNPFGAMFQVLTTGTVATWPPGADGLAPNSWQDVANVLCP